MKMSAKVLAALSVVLLWSCSNAPAPELVALVDAKNKWIEFAGNKPYTITMVMHCFCAEAGEEIVAIVDSERVTSATIKGESISPEGLPTIRQLFDTALESMKEDDGIETTVAYHPTQGWPTNYGYSTNVIDGSYQIEVHGVTVNAAQQSAPEDALMQRASER